MEIVYEKGIVEKLDEAFTKSQTSGRKIQEIRLTKEETIELDLEDMNRNGLLYSSIIRPGKVDKYKGIKLVRTEYE